MGVIENLPCDCAALGAVSVIVGLILNTYSYGETTLAGDKYSLSCGWDCAYFVVDETAFTFPYDRYLDDEKCVAKAAINSQDFEVDVCDEWTFYVGIGYLAAAILGVIITAISVQSQAPKFAAKKTTTFRIGLFLSGALYICGSFCWWEWSSCNSYHNLARTKVGVGISWYLISFGGVFNMLGSMFSFKTDDKRRAIRKATKRRKRKISDLNMSIFNSTGSGTTFIGGDYTQSTFN